MRNAKFFLLLITLFTLFNGCQLHFDASKDNQLQGTWRLSDVSSLNAIANNNKSFEQQAQEKQLVKEGMMFSFFEDKTFTEVRKEGQFIAGHWEFDNSGNRLLISYSDKARTSNTVKIGRNEFGREEMKLDDKDQNTELKFIKEAKGLNDFKSDPFYPENNQWRIKPSRKETESELTNRFAAYLKHIALILKAAKDRNQEVVYFEFSMGPIKIYNGGIGIHPYSIVPDSWKACFYDDSDSFRAYNIYEESISTHSYHGASTGNWVEDDYNILLSIYGDLKARK
jgi:hypothetical protein